MTIKPKFEEEEEYEEQESPWVLPKRRVKELETAGVQMNINELHQIQLNKLVNAFGVANTQSIVRDDRMARALGTTDSEKSTSEKGKIEY